MNPKQRIILAGAALIALLYATDPTGVVGSKPYSQAEKKEKQKIKTSDLMPLPISKMYLDAGHVGEGGKKGAEQPHGWADVLSGKYGFKNKISDYVGGERQYSREPDFTWAITEDLAKLVRKYSPNTELVLTARPENSISLAQKIKNVNSSCADGDVLVSIHIDYDNGGNVKAFYNQDRTGTRNWKEAAKDLIKNHTLQNTKVKNAEALANPVLESITKREFENKGLEKDDGNTSVNELGILRGPKKSGGYGCDMNAVLLEILSMDSEKDRQYLMNNSAEIAKRIYQGLMQYNSVR